jgi:uncharacterized protein
MKREDLLDLNDVLQHPGRTITVEISTEMESEEDLDLVAPLEGYLEAVSTGNLLLIKGEFSTKAIVECSRCGSPVEVEVSFELDEQFQVEGTPSSMNPQDMAKMADEEPYPLFDENNLMVEALLRQALLIAMPLQAFCPDGCVETVVPIAKDEDSAVRPEFQSLAMLKLPAESGDGG